MAIVDTLIGSYNLFHMANRYRIKQGISNEELFTIDLVALDKAPHVYSPFVSITPTKSIDQVTKTDLIIVPGVVGDMKEQIALNYPLINWMKEQRIGNHAEIASLCRGAFLLAETGLMYGKACATHWLTHDTFREMFPQVELAPDKVICEDNGIYSSGGAYSFLNLLLHLVKNIMVARLPSGVLKYLRSSSIVLIKISL